MMKKKWMRLLLMTMLVFAMAIPVSASESNVDSAGNYFAADDLVTLPGGPVSSAFMVGQNVTLSGSDVNGAVYAAGQSVDIGDIRIGESLFAAGNNVSVKDTDVTGNIFAAGNVISVSGGSRGNGVYLCGNTVTFNGEADYLFLAGENVTLGGTINGDVEIDANEVKIADDVEITGKLNIKAATEPELPSQIKAGNYSFEKVEEEEEDGAAKGLTIAGIGLMILKKIMKGIYWAVAMAAFGMLLIWLFDKDLKRAVVMMKERTGAMIGTGIISYFAIPAAAILLVCTLVLAPSAGIVMLAYVLLRCVGVAFAGASLSRLVFPKMNVFLSALIGIAALELVGQIPIIGHITGAVADMYLLAYVIQCLWMGRLRKKPAVKTMAEEAQSHKTEVAPAGTEETVVETES